MSYTTFAVESATEEGLSDGQPADQGENVELTLPPRLAIR